MTGVEITCDRQDGLIRAAVWQGKVLRDLYLDRLDRPDLTGAILRGKIVRVLADPHAFFVEGGLTETIRVQSAEKYRTGDIVTLRIQSAARQGKAWTGVLTRDESDDKTIGILAPPPPPWQRALEDLKTLPPAALHFSDRADHAACQAWLALHAPKVLPAVQLAKTPVHPDLDDWMDALNHPSVPLPHGGSLVIETTEALTVLDINGGEASNTLAFNLLAVKEAARQIRWRNLAGIIILDALKMKQREDKAKIINALARATADDPAGVQVFGLTKLGLLEIVRTRRGPSLAESLHDRN